MSLLKSSDTIASIGVVTRLELLRVMAMAGVFGMLVRGTKVARVQVVAIVELGVLATWLSYVPCLEEGIIGKEVSLKGMKL